MGIITINTIASVFPGSKIEDKHYLSHFFLQKIFSPEVKGYIEVRLIKPGEKPLQFYYETIDELTNDRELLELNLKGFNVYYGVNRRLRKSGRAEDVAQISCLWADVDDPGFDWQACDPPPDIVINTGNGFHLYWLLKRPIPADSKAQAILRGLQKKVGSDPVSDFPRVLRLPCSWNMKDLSNPKRVTIKCMK